MSPAEALLVTTYLAALGTALWLVGVAVADRISASGVERVFVGLLAAVATLEIILVAAGMLHLLVWPIVLGAAMLLAGISWRNGARLVAPSIRGWQLVGLAVPLGIALALSLNGQSFEADTRRYHIVNVAQWLHNESIMSLPYAQPGDHTAADPGGADLLSMVGAMITGDDRLAELPNLLAAALLLLATAVIVQRCGAPTWRAWVVVVPLLLSVEVLPTQLHSMMSDLFIAAMASCGAALLLMLRSPPKRSRRWLLILLGSALGFAAGAKYGGLPIAVGITLVAFVMDRSWRDIATIAAAGVAVGGVWYLRNALATGNPIYPQAVSLLGHAVLVGSPALGDQTTSLIGRLLQGDVGRLAYWASAMLTTLGAVTAVAMTGLILPVVRRQRETTVVLVAGLICLAAYAFLPYSGGGGGDPFKTFAGGVRYLLPALGVLGALAAARLPTRLLLILGGIGVVYDVAIDVHLPGRPDLSLTLGVALLAAVCCAGVAFGVWLAQGERRRVAVGALIAAAATAIALMMAPPSENSPIHDALIGYGVVPVIAVADMRSILGADLTIPVTSVGDGGTEGARRPLANANAIQQAIDRMHPRRVAVGRDDSDLPLPPWHPPGTWTVVARDGDTTVYAVP